MTADAKSGVKLLFIVVFGAIMALSLVPLAFFKLDEKKVSEMEQEIARRQSA